MLLSDYMRGVVGVLILAVTTFFSMWFVYAIQVYLDKKYPDNYVFQSQEVVATVIDKDVDTNIIIFPINQIFIPTTSSEAKITIKYDEYTSEFSVKLSEYKYYEVGDEITAYLVTKKSKDDGSKEIYLSEQEMTSSSEEDE